MASDAARATAGVAKATREKVAADETIVGEMNQRGEEDRTRALDAYKKSSAVPDEIKPWNAEIEHKKYESDPIQGFGSSGAVFAMIASAFTRAPMLSAIEGMTGALNGIKAGDEAAYTRAFDSYKENVKTAKLKHDIEHQAYTDALSLQSHDMQLSNAKLRAEATRFDDKKLLALAENGMVKEIYDTIAARNASVQSSVALAEKTTIRGLQQDLLKKSFAMIDAQPDVPDAMKAAQKLNQINTVMSGGKMGTPQQVAMSKLLMENPTMPAEELLKKAGELGIIKKSKQELQKDAVNHAVDQRAQELVDTGGGGYDMSAARKQARKELGVSEDGTQITAKTAKGIEAQIALQKARKIQEDAAADGREIDFADAYAQAKRDMTVKSTPPSANQVDKLAKLRDEADIAIEKSEKVMKFLESYRGGAGVFGKLMRGEEIVENIVGLSTQSDRAQMRRDVLSLQEQVTRIFTESGGARMLKSAQEKAQAVVAGLEAGDTGPNTRRAYRELIDDLKKRKQDISARVTGTFDPAKPRSGAPAADDGAAAPPPAGHIEKRPPPAGWLERYPVAR